MSVEIYERTGSPYWYARLTVGERTKRVSTRVPCSRSTKTEANKAALKLLEELQQEHLSTRSISLRSALASWLSNAGWGNNPATLRAYTGIVADIYAAVDTERTPLVSINTPWVRQSFTVFRSRLSPSKVRMFRTVITGVIDHAIISGAPGAPEVNPMRVVEKSIVAKKKPSKKTRYLTLPAVERLLSGVAGDPFWDPFITLALETGMRHQELLQLRWSETDLRRGVIELSPEREKAARGRIIPLSDHAIRALSGVKKYPPEERVWISRRTREPLNDIELRWRTLRKKLGFPNLRIHDLRHTFATVTRASGMSREDRMKIVGHSSTETHSIYAAVEMSTLRKALNRHSVCSLLTQERDNLKTIDNKLGDFQ